MEEVVQEMKRKEAFVYELHKSQDHGGKKVSSGQSTGQIKIGIVKEYMVTLLFIHIISPQYTISIFILAIYMYFNSSVYNLRRSRQIENIVSNCIALSSLAYEKLSRVAGAGSFQTPVRVLSLKSTEFGIRRPWKKARLFNLLDG